jgi:long-chain fatty acid transport protein
MLKSCLRLAAVLFFCLASGTALAEGFALYEYGARGVALGGALTARRPDASAVAYNPALITRLPGGRFLGGLTSISPAGDITYADSQGRRGDSRLKPSTWIVPHLYYTQQISDSLFFGIGEFTRYGLGFEYPHNWAGRFNIYEVNLLSASLNPNIAWAVTDDLSLAAGLEVVYVNLDIKKRSLLGGTSPAPYSFEVDTSISNATDYGLGFNLAGHYRFNENWSAGLTYRSQVHIKAYGDSEFSFMNYQGPEPLRPAVQSAYNAAFKDGSAHATVLLPDSFSGGIAWTPCPELSLEAGAVWTRWSTFRALNIHMPHGLPTAENPKHWKDVWRFNVGLEYSPLSWLTLRAGYVFDQSPMTERYEDYLIPTDDRDIYSLGVGFAWDAWTIDLAYAYIDAHERRYKGSADTHTLRSRTSGDTHLVSFSLGYSF